MTYKENAIVTLIGTGLLRWAGHVIQLKEQDPARTIFVDTEEGR